MALETLGIAAVRDNARCKLDRAALALGGNEGSAARRRTDRYNSTRSSSASAGTWKGTGATSASTDGVLTAGAGEQTTLTPEGGLELLSGAVLYCTLWWFRQLEFLRSCLECL